MTFDIVDGMPVFPEGITEIPAGAFENEPRLENLWIPEGVERIGSRAFAGCGALEDVQLPDTLETIGESAFEGCTALEELFLSVRQIGPRAFAGCTALALVSAEALTEIGDGAFRDCTALARVRLPWELESIGKGAFSGCTALETLELSRTPEYVAEDAFEGCSRLCAADIPAERSPYWIRYADTPAQKFRVEEERPGSLRLCFPENEALSWAWYMIDHQWEAVSMMKKSLELGCPLRSPWVNSGRFRVKGEIAEVGYRLPDMDEPQFHYIRTRDLLAGMEELRRRASAES